MFVFCVYFLVCAPRQCSYSAQPCRRCRWLHARILAFGQDAETAAVYMKPITPRAALSPVGASAKDVRMGFEKLTQRLSGEGAAADVTPMIDVLFLLLLFFIVTTTYNADSLFPLEWTQSDLAHHQGLADPGDRSVHGRALCGR